MNIKNDEIFELCACWSLASVRMGYLFEIRGESEVKIDIFASWIVTLWSTLLLSNLLLFSALWEEDEEEDKEEEGGAQEEI